MAAFLNERSKIKNPDPSGGGAGARIGICEASVASIHKLAMSPRVFIRTHKKYFVMRAAPEFHLALGQSVLLVSSILIHYVLLSSEFSLTLNWHRQASQLSDASTIK